MAELLSPTQDFRWLVETGKDLFLVARPKNKSHRILTTEQLVQAGLILAAEASELRALIPGYSALS